MGPLTGTGPGQLASGLNVIVFAAFQPGNSKISRGTADAIADCNASTALRESRLGVVVGTGRLRSGLGQSCSGALVPFQGRPDRGP
ncbi:MAG: hypothetical protein ACLQDY_17295 [Streptosporangiaceae bacterium]